jgi:hypothetical protein
MSEPRRIAQVWTPNGIFDVRIDGDWPAEIALEGFAYAPIAGREANPVVTRGRRTGVEFANYTVRRALAPAELAALADVPAADARPNDGKHASDGVDRSAATDDGAGAPDARHCGRRRYFGKQSARSAVRGRRPRD